MEEKTVCIGNVKSLIGGKRNVRYLKDIAVSDSVHLTPYASQFLTHYPIFIFFGIYEYWK